MAAEAPSGSSPMPGAAGRTTVVVTIDAEIAPHTSDWKRDRGRFALDRDVYGITPQGERGLRHQLDVIERSGLRSVVFLEALSAGVLGFDLLEEIVRLVEDRGHEVALHIHPNGCPIIRGRCSAIALADICGTFPRTTSGA